MIEETNVPQDANDGPDELTLLKERADLMGIKYHPNIGLDTLKAKIADKTASKEELNRYAGEELETIETAARVTAGAEVPARAVPTPQQLQMARRKKALKLVRIRVACMNPIKGNMKGEIISAGNAEVGMVKKFIPFNADQGWHVPQIILTVLQNKKFMSHYEVKVGNKKIKKNRLIPEFAIEILPPLTSKELDELKQRQLMAQGQ